MQTATIMQQMYDIRSQTVYTISNVIGRTPLQTATIIIRGMGYIIGLIIMIPIHRAILKRHHKFYKEIVQWYDQARYQVAKAQQAKSISTSDMGIINIINTPNASYLQAHPAIKQEIMHIEQTLGVSIIIDNERNLIQKKLRKKHRIYQRKNIIGWILTIATYGIYKLFR